MSFLFSFSLSFSLFIMKIMCLLFFFPSSLFCIFFLFQDRLHRECPQFFSVTDFNNAVASRHLRLAKQSPSNSVAKRQHFDAALTVQTCSLFLSCRFFRLSLFLSLFIDSSSFLSFSPFSLPLLYSFLFFLPSCKLFCWNNHHIESKINLFVFCFIFVCFFFSFFFLFFYSSVLS